MMPTLTAPSRAAGYLASRLSGALGLAKLNAMEHNIEPAGGLKHRLGTAAEDRDRVRKHQLFRYPRHGVVVSADLENPDAGLMQACHLRGQEARRFHRRLVAIIKIAGDDECIDTLRKAEIDNGDERLAAGVSDELGEIGVSHRQRTQRRVEMNVGRVYESKCHSAVSSDGT